LLATWERALDSADQAIHSAQEIKVFSAAEVRELERDLRAERVWLSRFGRFAVLNVKVRNSVKDHTPAPSRPRCSRSPRGAQCRHKRIQVRKEREMRVKDLMTAAVAPDTHLTEVDATKPILVAEGVRKVYRSGADSVVALYGLDLVVPQGEFLAVMGPSGSGKTTLLNCLSGLDEIDDGRVLVDDLSIHELSDKNRTKHRAKEMGFIFQAFNLIPVFTATENVELPLLLAGVREHDARARARETLKRVGLGHRLDRRPMELSGGEQQRVAVARALAGKPRIVWADEPTGNLDSEMAGAVIELLGELHKEGLTLILVTHDPTVAAHADRLITVRDGRLVADEHLGRPSELVPEVVAQ
jgi:putative ABC transport system ATP-binding protein